MLKLRKTNIKSNISAFFSLKSILYRPISHLPYGEPTPNPVSSSSTTHHPTSPRLSTSLSILRSKTAKDEKLRRTSRRIKVASPAPARLAGQTGGFTIVELLVVIVIIAILAAITILAYTGISQKAITASLQSDLVSAKKQLNLFQVDNSAYPTTISTNCATNPTTPTNLCLKISSGNSYGSSYTANNTTNPQTFSLTATNTNSSIAYIVTNSTSPISTTYVPPTPISAIAAITGTTTVGSVLTAGALTPSGATVTYQWQSATTVGGTYTNISSATNSTYTLQSTDSGKYIKVVATATGVYSGIQTSTATSAVSLISLTGIGLITGTTAVGSVLTAGALTPSDATVTYQWQSAATVGGTYNNISGATSSAYTLISTDWLKYIKVVATAIDSYTGTQTSAVTTIVTDPYWIAGKVGTILEGKYVYYQQSGHASWDLRSSLCAYGGGRAPTRSEMTSITANRVFYGDNLYQDSFWTSESYDTVNAYAYQTSTNIIFAYTKSIPLWYRCVAG